MEKGRRKVLNFFQQINNEEINENQKQLKNQLINATKAQEPLELILKDYFESTHCFGINYGNEIVNGIPIPEMFLSFRIFNEGLTDLQNSDKESSLVDFHCLKIQNVQICAKSFYIFSTRHTSIVK